MKFSLDDHKLALSHLVLNNIDLTVKLTDTPQWKENELLEATLYINGISVPAELIEQTMQYFYTRCEQFFEEKYNPDVFDQRVEERAVQLLKESADNALERIYKLTQILEEPDVLLSPHWKRESN